MNIFKSVCLLMIKASCWLLSFGARVSFVQVLVKLNVELLIKIWLLFCTGILTCLDGYMNIAMEQTEEYVNGQLKNKYGDAFIRGNNGN